MKQVRLQGQEDVLQCLQVQGGLASDKWQASRGLCGASVTPGMSHGYKFLEPPPLNL